MAMKRIRKELQLFQSIESENVSALNRWSDEKQYWTLKPSHDSDIFKWIAVLRPGCGPFQGGHLTWQLNFPADYPFNPPTLSLICFGKGIPFDEACVGMEVSLYPSTESQRVKGRLIEKNDDDITIQRITDPLSLSGQEDEADALAGARGSDGSCARGAQRVLAPRQYVENKEWWDNGACPAFVDAVMFHPFVQCEGTAVCFCGVKNEHSPACSFSRVLAFVRVAVENPGPESKKPVPCGGDDMMCFCQLCPEAAQAREKDAAKWFRVSRAHFFGSAGVVPLCLSISLRNPTEIEIECRSIGGECLATFNIARRQTCWSDLVDKVSERVPLPENAASWKLVLPDGRSGDDIRSMTTLVDLFKC